MTATGGERAAGIGGGDFDKGTNITISGGTVTAKGGKNGAGIGGGNGGDGTNITISGGTVTVTGGYEIAGIGGNGGSGSNNKISPQNGSSFIVTGDKKLTKRTAETDISGWMEQSYTITFDHVTASYAFPGTGNAGVTNISISSGSITSGDRLVVSDNKAKLVSDNTQGLGYDPSAVSIVSASAGTTATLADFAARNANSVVFAGDISLASGTNTFANGALLSFNVGTANAGQPFTMIHFTPTEIQTAVGIADADGFTSYSIGSASPFILIKGEYTVSETPPTTDTPTSPQTGDNSNTLLWIVLLLVSGVAFTGMVIDSKKKRTAR